MRAYLSVDEIIRAGEAKNGFVGIERLTEEEIEDLRSRCEERARQGQAAVDRVSRKADAAADRAAWLIAPA